MMAPTRRVLIFGGALILVTNAIALGGVEFNRSGTSDAVLSLSERELALSEASTGSSFHEDSGLSLRLRWDVHSVDVDADHGRSRYWHPGMGYIGGVTPWLDERKLEALGISTAPGLDASERMGRLDHSMGRDVFLVLEMNGPAYAEMLGEVRERARQAEALADSRPEDSDLQTHASTAKEQSAIEENGATRLIVVDAGLDPVALRQLHPGRAQNAIVHGHIRPVLISTDGKSVVTGIVSAVRCDSINVPVQFRTELKPLESLSEHAKSKSTTKFQIEVAFGRRFEPWLKSVRYLAGANGGAANH